jgi:hypothetical protein
MPSCPKCDTLLGQHAGTPPHAELRGGAVFTCCDMVLERYRCRLCYTTWDRLKCVAKEHVHRWTRLAIGPTQTD